jgi:hypothetical protein
VSPLSETVVSCADGSSSPAVAMLPCGRATSDAWVPRPACIQFEKPIARDPTKDASMPSATPTMRPARSQPGVYGAVMLAGSHDAIPPVTIPASAGLMVADSGGDQDLSRGRRRVRDIFDVDVLDPPVIETYRAHISSFGMASVVPVRSARRASR